MLQISKEENKKCKVEIIDKRRYFWVNRRNLEVESDVANWPQIFYKCDPEKQKYRQELASYAEYQQCSVFMRNDSVEKKKSCRKPSKRFLEFKKELGLDPNLITCDEQDIISALQVVFEGEIVLTQYCIKNKRIDACFSKYKLGIEVDEYNHESRNPNYEKSRQLIIESHGITITRINPDAADSDMNKLINYISTLLNQIKKIGKEKLEKEKEAEIKELKVKNKELITKIKKSTTNQITNNFGKIIIKN